MRKSVLLGLGGAAILGGWALKSYLDSKGESSANAENLANAGENLAFANANSATGEKVAFKDELGEFSQNFNGENLPCSEKFTQKGEKMKMRDLEALQDEALQDRSWMSATSQSPEWDGGLVFDGTKINDLDELLSNFVPSCLCENLANGRLEKWLENKATICKNEQKIQAFKAAAEQVKKIAKNSTRLEATKALYEIFREEKVAKWLEDIFEFDIRWNALQAMVEANIDKQIALVKRLETYNDDERQALRDEYMGLDNENNDIRCIQEELDADISKVGNDASTQEMLIHFTISKYHTSRQFKNIRESLPSSQAVCLSMLDDMPEPDEIDKEKLHKAIDELEGK